MTSIGSDAFQCDQCKGVYLLDRLTTNGKNLICTFCSPGISYDPPAPTDYGVKHDAGKLPYELLPFETVDALVAVLQHGIKKYGYPGSWKNVQPFEERYVAAALRHISKARQGERIDPDSGLSHYQHAFCNLMFLVWGELQRKP